MISLACERVKRQTIADDRMRRDKSLNVARQPTCEDHNTTNEKYIIQTCPTKKKKTKANGNRNDSRFERKMVRFGDRRYLTP
jgi:hypothetical protein